MTEEQKQRWDREMSLLDSKTNSPWQQTILAADAEIKRLRAESAALKQKVVEMDECDRDIDRDWQQIQRRAAEVRPGCHSAYEALDLVPQLQAENSALKAERDGLAVKSSRLVDELLIMQNRRMQFACGLEFADLELRKLGYSGAILDPSDALAGHDAEIRKPLEKRIEELEDTVLRESEMRSYSRTYELKRAAEAIAKRRESK